MTEYQRIDFSSGASLMAHGPEALHHDYAARLEKAMGNALPQMEVRVQNISLTAKVVVHTQDQSTYEMPTVGNTFKRIAKATGRRKTQQTVDKPILHNISGVFKPGSMTLVLGQPGSGKSSLLKVLSGRFPLSKTVAQEGEISYNGVSPEQLKTHLPQFVSYVPQRDRHFSTLSVKETLEFAHECCGGELSARDEKHFNKGTPEQNKAALEAARTVFKHYPEVVIQQLGLEHCQDTVVGDAMIRGVSGGERKRVTIGEMEFGNKYVTLMDEISTGLDSAAAYDIVKTQRSIAQKLRKTVVMALLQPSPEIFDLFDTIVVLNQGYVMYNGPRDQVEQYFRSLGFVCPPERDVAEFLLDVGTNKQGQYACMRDSASLLPRSPHEFAQLYEESFIYSELMDQLETPVSSTLEDQVANHFADMPEFHQSFWASTLTLLTRELKVTWRNKALIKGRAIVLGALAVIYSLLFFQFDEKNPQVVFGTIFPAILFFCLGQSAQISRFMVGREIFYKQRDANFYRTSSYVIASALNQIPLAACESIIFSGISYWVCGFVTDIWAFGMFVLILFLTNLAFAAWFFMISALSPNVHVAEPMSMLSLLMYVLFAGFIITHEDIPVYFEWIYWLDPVSWGLRILAINQFGNDKFATCVFDGIDYCKLFKKKMGVYSLETYDIYTERVWMWFGVAFMIASFAVYMALSWYILENIRHDETTHATAEAVEDDEARHEDTYALEISTPKADFKGVVTPRDATMDISVESYLPSFTPVTLAFKDLHYSVPNPADPDQELELLKGISGFAKPGNITALMGSSGAGKTTLMDVIAGRKTGGKIQGHILLNGYEATDLAIRRATGYCEQMDIHSEAATFREALTFSAFLRQDVSVSDAQKHDSVEECLDLLDLRPIADKIIRGSSVEQMKRLTIGVELAAQPSVLFLDEPTSGLDAPSAKMIMDGVRKVADTGRTVVCTIHQPSTEVFQIFDSLLLLKRGGETVYFGELGKNSSEMIKYFEAIEGVVPLEKDYNPATWMLEVIGAGVGNTAGDDKDFVQIFNASEKKAALDATLDQDGVTRPAAGIPALEFTNKRAASELVQAKFVIQRFLRMYWRTTAYNSTRIIIFTVLALVFGLIFREVEYTTYRGINSGVGMLFISTMFLGTISFKSVMPLMFEDRNAFYRERASQTYNALWYFVGTTIAEVPYVFGSTLLFSAVFFPLVGFTGLMPFLRYWVHLSMHVLLQTYLGQFLAFTMPTLEVCTTMGTLFIAVSFLFMGFNPPAKLIPIGYKWLYTITPAKYSLAILSSIVFGDCSSDGDVACERLQNAPPTLPADITVSRYVDEVFLVDYDEIWSNFAFVMLFFVVLRFAGLLALRFINHQKR